MDLNFLINCGDNNITPKFVTWKNLKSKRHKLRSRPVYYMTPERSQTGMKIEIISRQVRNHEISPTRVTPAVLAQFFTLALLAFLFLYFTLLRMRFSAFRTGLRMHFVFTFMPAELSRFGSAGGVTSDRSELFSSRSHVNIYYK